MKIACLGGVTADNYVDQKKVLAGGCGLNNAVHYKKIEPQANVSVVGAIGKDTFGEALLRYLHRREIDTSHLSQIDGKTSVQNIKNMQHGEKLFFDYDPGVIATLKPTHKDLTFLHDQDAIVGSLFLEIEPYLKDIVSQKYKGDVVIDFRDLADYDRDLKIVHKYIDNVDIGFFGLTTKMTDHIKELSQISKMYNKLFIITLSDDGVIAFDKGVFYQQNVEKVADPIDTTGAGDAFLSAFLADYYQSHSIQSSLKAGCDYAAKVVQIIGAN